MDYTVLPTVNTTLNSITAVLLVVGYSFIKRDRVEAHKACMIAATACSALFLISYVIYHYHVGSVRYPGTGALRVFYLSLLATHVVLAAVNVPLVLMTLIHAARDRRDKHRRWARVTLPVWLYVSVTGVVVYLMLYVFPPDGG